MKLDKAGAELIMQFEGLRLKPYLDSVNVPTIGYGTTYYPDGRKATMQDATISKERAFELLTVTANKFASGVAKLIARPVNQNQFNALVSISYNIGLGNFKKSTLLRKVNFNPNDPAIALEFAKWNKAGGKVIKGLTNRRKIEADLYFDAS